MKRNLFILVFGISVSGTAFAVDGDNDGYAPDGVGDQKDCDDKVDETENVAVDSTVDVTTLVPETCFVGKTRKQEAVLVEEFNRCSQGGGAWTTEPSCGCQKAGMAFIDVVPDYIERPLDRGVSTKIWGIRELVPQAQADSAAALARLRGTVKELDARVDAHDVILAEHEQRLDGHDAAIAGIDARVTALATDLDTAEAAIVAVDDKVGAETEARVAEDAKIWTELNSKGKPWFTAVLAPVVLGQEPFVADVDGSGDVSEPDRTLRSGTAFGGVVLIQAGGVIKDHVAVALEVGGGRLSESGDTEDGSKTRSYGGNIGMIGASVGYVVNEDVTVGGFAEYAYRQMESHPTHSRVNSSGAAFGPYVNVGIADSPVLFQGRLLVGPEAYGSFVDGEPSNQSGLWGGATAGLGVRF